VSQPSYLALHETRLPGAATVIIHILNRRHDDLLGTIRWYGPWRQYVFEPMSAVFSAGCLEEIQGAVREANAKQRERWAERRKPAQEVLL
jgi:hypothetical protein